MSGARILVIGCSGQVGFRFKEVFADRDQLSKNFFQSAKYTFTDISPNPGSGDIVCDLTDDASILAAIKMANPTVIINCAAYTAVDKSETERELCMTVNGHAPKVMADAAAKIGATLVHYSTDYVFDGSGTAPWKEDDLTKPVNYYGTTKLAGENAVRASGCKHLILRTQWVYSDHGHNFVKTMLRLGGERPELKVVGDQIGAPTSAETIVKVTLELLERFESGKITEGIYNVVCSGQTSWHGFAERIFADAKALHAALAVRHVAAIPSEEFPTPAKRPLNSRMSLSKTEQALGHALPSWQSALQPILKKLLHEKTKS